MKFLLSLVSTLAFAAISCGPANTVTVKGTVKNQLGAPVSNATILISDPDQCCAGLEKPCTYSTDTSGGWNLYFATGKAQKDGQEAKAVCSYTVTKTGYSSTTGTFSYCTRGPCSGEQNVASEATVSP